MKKTKKLLAIFFCVIFEMIALMLFVLPSEIKTNKLIKLKNNYKIKIVAASKKLKKERLSPTIKAQLLLERLEKCKKRL